MGNSDLSSGPLEAVTASRSTVESTVGSDAAASLACAACVARGKTWKGDDPVCAFPNGSAWRPENWNCATDGMLRELVTGGNPYAGGTHFDGAVSHFRESDQNVAAIALIDLDIDAQMLAMTWYKTRGRTEQVWLIPDDGDPRRPTEAEAVAIIAAFNK